MTRAAIYRPLVSERPNRAVIKMPFHKSNRSWLKNVMGAATRPEWNGSRSVWMVARTHFPAVVAALAERYGAVKVMTEHALTELCTDQCQRANPETWLKCECVCGGHGHGHPGGGKAVGDGGLVVYSDRVRRTYIRHADGTIVDINGT